MFGIVRLSAYVYKTDLIKNKPPTPRHFPTPSKVHPPAPLTPPPAKNHALDYAVIDFSDDNATRTFSLSSSTEVMKKSGCNCPHDVYKDFAPRDAWFSRQ